MQAVLDPVLDPGFDPVEAALAVAVERVDADGWDDGAGQWPGLEAGVAALLDRAATPSDPPSDASGVPGLRGACERLAAAAPGPDTLAALGVLCAPGVLVGLDEGGRVQLAAAWERAAVWVAACTAPVLVAADDAAADDVTRDGPDDRGPAGGPRPGVDRVVRCHPGGAGRRADQPGPGADHGAGADRAG